MKQFETRLEYMDAIARAMGLEAAEDLAHEHRSVLQVEHFARLGPILDMVETAAASSRDEEALGDEDGEALLGKMFAVGDVVVRHRDSKVKAVQALVAELDAILEGGSDASVPQS